MVDHNLAQMGDRELLRLFAISSAPPATSRSRQVRAELERRGYHFDSHQQAMVTCEEWNKRYPDQCAEAARRRDTGR